MNKQSINKYKAEFDYWLDDGTLLRALARDSQLKWKPCAAEADFFNTNEDYYVYIINDKYVELRKAIAEDKTVQFWNGDKWDNCETPNFTDEVSKYRIKPKSTFQIGDWVRYKDAVRPKRITDGTSPTGHCACNKDGYSYNATDLVLWKPKHGELCVFWDNNTPDFYTVAAYDGTYRGKPTVSNGDICDNVAPVAFDLNIYSNSIKDN